MATFDDPNFLMQYMGLGGPAAQPSPALPLLGYDPRAVRQQALFQGLTGLGMGLLQAGARSTDPGNQARGIAAGIGGFQHGMESAQQKALQQYLMMKQLNAPIKVGRGDTLFSPTTGKPIFQSPAPETEVGKLLAEHNQLPPGHPNRAIYQRQLAMIGQQGGFSFREDENGNLVGAPVQGGPADPRYVQAKSAASAAGEAPFKVTPLQPGAGFVVGVPGAGGGAPPPPQPQPRPAQGATVQTPQGPSPVLNNPLLPPTRGTAPPADPGMPTQTRQPDGVRHPMQGGLQKVGPGVYAPPGPAEKSFDDEYGKLTAKNAVDLEANGTKAQIQADNYRRFLIYQDNVKTGKLAPAAADIAAWAQSFGLDPKGLGLDRADGAQAMEALTNKLVQGNIGGEGGMPANNFSNADREFIVKIEPSLRNTPGGNRLIAEANMLLAERTAMKAEKWLEARETGKTWLQFEREWRAFARENPVFGDAFRAKVEQTVKPANTGAGGQTGSAEPDWVVQGGKVVRNPNKKDSR